MPDSDMPTRKIKVRAESRMYLMAVLGLLLAIAAALVIRFLNPGELETAFTIPHLDRIELRTLEDRPAFLSRLLKGPEPSAFLVFGLHDCYSCVAKGLMDLTDLRKSGYHCFAVAVHDRIADLRGWIRHENFSPFYMMGKADFHSRVTCHAMPVLVIGDADGVVNYRFIKP